MSKLREDIARRPLQARIASQDELIAALRLPALLMLAVLIVALALLRWRATRLLGIIVLVLWAGAAFLYVRALGGWGTTRPPGAPPAQGDANKVLRLLHIADASEPTPSEEQGDLSLTDADLNAFLAQVIRLEGEPAADGSLHRTALRGDFTAEGILLREWVSHNGSTREIDYSLDFDARNAAAPWALDSVTISGMPVVGSLKTLLWTRLSEGLRNAFGEELDSNLPLRFRNGAAELATGAPAPPQSRPESPSPAPQAEPAQDE